MTVLNLHHSFPSAFLSSPKKQHCFFLCPILLFFLDPMASLAPTSLSKDPLSNATLTIFGSIAKSGEIQQTQFRLWTSFRKGDCFNQFFHCLKSQICFFYLLFSWFLGEVIQFKITTTKQVSGLTPRDKLISNLVLTHLQYSF
ncbi:hypothetical protein REPUB_Repub01dG0210200 [Reevesia pubescens]